MFKILDLYFNQNKVLVMTTLISLLIHILFLCGFTLILPSRDKLYQTFEMRLVNLSPQQKITTNPQKKKSSKPKVKKSIQSESASNIHATNTLPEMLTEQDAMPISIQKSETTDTVTQENSEDLAQETIEILSDSIINDPVTPPYQFVETEFEVYRGSDLSSAGVASITFSIDEEGAYQIISTIEAKELASLFYNTLTQKSEGVITKNGLVPSYYSYQFGDDETKAQSARFIWSDSVLLMQSARGNKSEPLIAGTQDFLSFMYQFMYAVPLENTQITMTNGKVLRTYSYSFEGEEFINSKIGELKTIHLLKSGKEDEKTELWLALDYYYLPVKIRRTEKNGSVLEQVVSRIRADSRQ